MFIIIFITILSIISFCTACASTLTQEQRSQKTINWLELNFSRYENPKVNTYLSAILERLHLATQNQLLNIDLNKLNTDWKIHIFQSNSPNAFSAGSGNIILTKQLIISCESEAELASIIAHEMSHYYLEHSQEDSSYSLKREIEADTLALSLIELAGYRQDASISALNILYRQGNNNFSDYQQKRTDNLSQLLKSKVIWGINNTREFNNIKNYVARSTQ